MEKEKLFDISEACKILGTTSRTLRFYEEKGIIKSTPIPFQTRRQYSAEQIRDIKNVLVLRSLGLPISKIQAMQSSNVNLSDVIAEHKTEVLASIASKMKELNMLNEALTTIDGGGDIFIEKELDESTGPHNLIEIANTFTDAFITGDLEKCFSYFSEMLRDYLPLDSFKRVTDDTLKPLGCFICQGKTKADENLHNVIYSYLKYEKMNLRLKFVFFKSQVHGFWLNYSEFGA